MILPIKVGILTASDRCAAGKRIDESGNILKALAEQLPAEVVAHRIVSDDKERIKSALLQMVDLLQCHLVLTTGGTGLGPRDNTPEATREVIEKEIPGISEAIREGGKKKTRFSVLSRGIAGVRNKTLIINFPGSPDAVRDALEILKPVLSHALELVDGDVSDCQDIREEESKVHSHATHHSRPLHS